MASRAFKRLVPLLDRVVVEKVTPPTSSIGGVIIPDSLKTKLNEARVVAVGPGAIAKDGARIPMGVKEGDHVLLPEFGGTKVQFEQKELYIFRDEDILGVLKE
eukprot:tig00000691_g3178.t1